MPSLKPPYDPELAPVLAALPQGPVVTRETLEAMREGLNAGYTPALVWTDGGLSHREETITGPDGNTIALTIVTRAGSTATDRPGIYHVHGGGMIVGTRLFALPAAFPWIHAVDAVLVSVEYRLAPEHPAPAQLTDCYAGLEWMAAHAPALGVDPARLMVAGFSAGGGLAAGLALMARDRPNGPALCAQMLCCPMLDDRMASVSSQQYMNEGSWSGRTSLVAWSWILPEGHTADVSIYVAPARATDLSRLPPTWLDVGSAELFRDEDVAYATKLWEHGNATELHVWPGVWHGSEMFAPQALLTIANQEARLNWLKRVFAKTPTARL